MCTRRRMYIVVYCVVFSDFSYQGTVVHVYQYGVWCIGCALSAVAVCAEGDIDTRLTCQLFARRDTADGDRTVGQPNSGSGDELWSDIRPAAATTDSASCWGWRTCMVGARVNCRNCPNLYIATRTAIFALARRAALDSSVRDVQPQLCHHQILQVDGKRRRRRESDRMKCVGEVLWSGLYVGYCN